MVTSVGGKGLDVAVVLKALGAPVQAVSFVAGRNGETLAGLLKDRQIPVDWVWVPGETRVAHVIVETDLNHHSHITTPGYEISAPDCEAFKARLQKHAQHTEWAVISGSLPSGVLATLYREIMQLLHEMNVKVLIDCAGEPMPRRVQASPEIVKMNQAEFFQTFGTRPQSLAGWIKAVRQQMQQNSIQNFVLTCGEEGLLAFTPEAVYQAQAPQQTEVNAAGSGDAAWQPSRTVFPWEIPVNRPCAGRRRPAPPWC